MVLLNFWATWCIPCRAEIPSLNAMQHDLERAGLSVIGVSYDDTADVVQRISEGHSQSYQDCSGRREVGFELAGVALPTTYIIDRRDVFAIR